MVTITIGCIRCGVWFKSPIPPSLSSSGGANLQIQKQIQLQNLSPHHYCETCMEPPRESK
jgi:hypothetical protein